MKRLARVVLRSLPSFFLVLAAATAFGGCASDDQVTTRPWNTPKTWENGLPSAMTEGR
jgi:hypothetical protein